MKHQVWFELQLILRGAGLALVVAAVVVFNQGLVIDSETEQALSFRLFMPALVLILAGGLLRGQFEKRVRQDELRAGARQPSLGANPHEPGPV